MTRRTRAWAALPAAALAAVLLAGCDGKTSSAAPATNPATSPASSSAVGTPGSTAPAPSASELAHMQKLVDDAASAAAAADSDAVKDN